jgi:hypothetical protein
VDYGSSLITRKIHEGFSFIFRENNVAGQSEHFEQLDCFVVHFRKGDARAALFGDVDDSEENRDTDTVNQFGIAEINDESTATATQLPATLALDLFTGQLIKVIACVNNRSGANTV